MMRVDSAGLGHSVIGGAVAVHYPTRDASGALVYGAPFFIGPVPPSYWTTPPNAITAERVAIWRDLGAP